MLYRSFDGALGAEDLRPGNTLRGPVAATPLAETAPAEGEVLRLLPPADSSEGSMTSEGRMYDAVVDEGIAPVVPSDMTSSGTSSTVTLADAG